MRSSLSSALFVSFVLSSSLVACQAETREQAKEAGRAMIKDAKQAADEVADRAPGARKIERELKRAGRKAKKVLKREAEVMEKAVKLNGRTLRQDIEDFGADDKAEAKSNDQ